MLLYAFSAAEKENNGGICDGGGWVGMATDLSGVFRSCIFCRYAV